MAMNLSHDVPFIGGNYAYVNSHLYGSGPSMETEFRGTDMSAIRHLGPNIIFRQLACPRYH